MILQRIKEETALAHTQLEQSPLLSHFGQKTIDRSTYLCILEKFYGFWQPIEQGLDKFPLMHSYLPDYQERKKATLLLNDLSTLHQRSIEGSEIPSCQDLPLLENTHHAIGCLYVLEGSTLGARIISKILQDKLQVYSHNGASYFNGYGADTGDKWKKFCQALLDYSLQFGEEDQIVEAANETFTKLRTWLTN